MGSRTMWMGYSSTSKDDGNVVDGSRSFWMGALPSNGANDGGGAQVDGSRSMWAG